MSKSLILIELNELNFEFARPYTDKLGLAAFRHLLSQNARRTQSEAQYDLLEPWIQWVSAHSGKNAASHGIFRLGDIVHSNVPQLFEAVERAGFSVGSVCAMNAENRLSRSAYFISDPWTQTPSDDSWWSRALSEAIAQAVNDNAQGRLSSKTLTVLLAGLLRFAQPKNYGLYLRLASTSRGSPWRKALFLDLFLHDLHFKLFRSKRPSLSTLFVNAAAHIQHHYLFNARHAVQTTLRNPNWYVDSNADPFSEMLQVYDRILGDYFALEEVDLIVATGLTQVPYDTIKYYWRLKNHAEFIHLLGIRFRQVLPRMTRDFLIEFDSSADANTAEAVLKAVTAGADGTRIFGEVHNRGTSVFVTLTWPDDVTDTLYVAHPGGSFRLRPHVAFVAIKNGMHHGHGFVFYKGKVTEYAAPDGAHIKNLYDVIIRYFGIDRGVVEQHV